MSSDKPPEKLYYDFINDEITRIESAFSHTYIREDLTLDAKLQYPGAVTTMTIQEFEQQRRREMFEKVALVKIKDGFGYSRFEVAQMAGWILADADKFARGEE